MHRTSDTDSEDMLEPQLSVAACCFIGHRSRLVTPDRLTAIRERMLECADNCAVASKFRVLLRSRYLGECSEAEGHPLADLLQTYLQESEALR